MGAGGGMNLGTAYGQVIIDTTQAIASLQALEGAMAGTNAAAERQQAAAGGAAAATGRWADAATVAGVTSAIFLGAAINQAANFEFRMDAIQSVLGATTEQMSALGKEILRVGAESSFTNNEVADVAQELAKLGISYENIIGGALTAITDLSAATETAPDVAASVLGAAMNQYQIQGEGLTRVADLFTRAANQSAADVTSLGTGFVYAAGTASALGIPIEDLLVSLELLNDRGIKGSMAGTTLNQALLSLVSPTDKAAGVMEELGISMYDAEGNFIGLHEAVQVLDKALEGLTQEQQMNYLNDIFTVRGARAIFELLKAEEEATIEAGKGWESYREGLESGLTAQEQAAARLDNLLGSWEKFRGAIDSLLVTMGTPFLGVLKAVVDAMTAVVNVIANLNSEVLGLASALMAPLAVFGILSAIARIAGVSFLRLIPGMRAVGAAAGALSGPLAIATAAVALFIAAYKSNFGGLADFIDGVIDKLQQVRALLESPLDFFGLERGEGLDEKLAEKLGLKGIFGFIDRDAKKSIQEQLDDVTQFEVDPDLKVKDPSKGDEFDAWYERHFDDKGRRLGELEQKFRRLGSVLDFVFGTRLQGVLQATGRGLDRFVSAGDKIRDQFQDISRVFRNRGFIKGFQSIFGKNGQELLEGFGDGLAAIPKLFGGVLKALETGIPAIDNILERIGRVAETFGRVIQELFQGDLTGFGEVVERLARQIGEVFTAIFDALIAGAQAIPWGEVWAFVVDLLVGAATVLGTITGGLLSIGWSIATAIYNAIMDGLGASGEGAAGVDWGAVWTSVREFLEAALPATLELGKEVVLSFVFALDKTLFGTGGLRGWLLDQLGLNGSGEGGVRAGASAIAGAAGIVSGSEPINMGVLLLKFTAKLAGTIWGELGDFASWLMIQIGALGTAAGGFVVDTAIPVTLNFAARLGRFLWGATVSAPAWLWTQVIAAVDWTIGTAIPVTLNFFTKLGSIAWGASATPLAWLWSQVVAASDWVIGTAIPATLNFLAEFGEMTWGGFSDAGAWLYSKMVKVIPVEGIKATLDIAVSGLKGEIEEWRDGPADKIATYLNWGTGVAKDVAVGTVRLIVEQVEMVAADVEGTVSESGLAMSIIDSIASSLSGLVGDASALADAAGPALSNLGSALVDLLVSALTWEVDLPAMREAGNRLGFAIGQAIQNAMKFLIELDSDTVGDALGDIGSTVIGLIVAALTALGAGAIAVPAALLNLGEQIFLAIIQGIAGVAEGLIGGALEGTKLGEMANGVVTAIFNGIANALGAVQDLASIAGVINNLGTMIWNFIGDAIKSVFGGGDDEAEDAASGAAAPIMRSLARAFQTEGDGGEEGTSVGESIGLALLEGIGTGLRAALDKGGEILSGAIDAIKGVILELLDRAIDEMPGGGGMLGNFLRNLLGIDDGGSAAAGAGKTLGRSYAVAIAKLEKEYLAAISDTQRTTMNHLARATADASNDFRILQQDIMTELADLGYGDAPAEPAPTAGAAMLSGLSRGFEKTAGEVESMVGNVIDRIKNAVPKEPIDLKLPPIRIMRQAATEDTGVSADDLDVAAGGGPAAVTVPAPNLAAFQAGMAQVPVIVARAMAAATLTAGAGGVLIATALSTSVNQGVIAVTQVFNIMVAYIGVKLAEATGIAQTEGAAIGQAIAAGVQAGVLSAIQAINILAAYIPVALASAAASAYSAGVNVGSSLAAGIQSQTGAVYQAAANLAAAAQAGTNMALQIKSPSKKFIKTGIFIGQGLMIGMRRTFDAVRRTGERLGEQTIFGDPNYYGSNAAARSFPHAAPVPVGGGITTVNNYQTRLDVDMNRVRQVNEVIDFITGFERGVELAKSTKRSAS